MITYIQGNQFDSAAQVITNTVNCVGVMGKGIALDFKKRFPAMFNDYQARCKSLQVKPGTPYLWEDDRTQILNFPTKRHWNEPSHLEDIDAGLAYLARNHDALGIRSLALPALGCGNGGLEWSTVKSLIEKHLGPIEALDVFVYEPRIAAAMPNSLDEAKRTSDSLSDGMAAQQALPF